MHENDYLAGRYGGTPSNPNSPSYQHGLVARHDDQLREHYKKINEHNEKFKESIRQQQNQSASYTSDGDGLGWLFVLAVIICGVMAAIGYNIFETKIAGWIGFGIGVFISLVIPGIREAVVSVVLGIGILGLLGWGIYFIIDTFSDNPDTKQQASKGVHLQFRVLGMHGPGPLHSRNRFSLKRMRN